MKEIAKALDINYNQRHKVAFGVISNYKLFIKRDDLSNSYILSFDISGEYLSQYKCIALRSTHRSIVNIETFGMHSDITITASANKSEDAENIKSVIRHLVLLLKEDFHISCCGACQTTEKKLFPFYLYDKYLYVCNNCSTKTKSKLIVPDGENHLKGFLGAFIFSLPVAILFSYLLISDEAANATDTATDTAIASVMIGAVMGLFAMIFYQRLGRSPKYRQSITYTSVYAREGGVTRMPSIFGVFLSFVATLLGSALSIIFTYLFYLIEKINLSFTKAVLTLPNVLANPLFNIGIDIWIYLFFLLGSLLGIAISLLFVRFVMLVPQSRQR